MTVSQPSARLYRLWDEPVFSVAGAEYAWIDVVLWAMAHGEWPVFERRLAQGIACVTRASAENTLPSDDEIEAAATAFRYDRELLAASEISDWLDDAELTLDDWMAYLTRDLLRGRWHDSLDAVGQRFPPATSQLLTEAFAEGVCSRAFEQFEAAFSSRVAVIAMHASSDSEDHDTADAIARVVQTHAPWLSSRSNDETRQRLSRVLAIEERFNATMAELIVQAPLAHVVEQHRWQWQQVELDTVRFDHESAAREAVLCVHVDRLSLHDVAALARRAAERRRFFADELEADYRDRVFGVDPGQVLGPLAVNGHFEVSAVVRRTSPALTDERVAARARQTFVDAVIRRATRDQLTRRSRA